MRPQRLIAAYLTAALLPVGLLLAALFAYDPLTLFHRPWLRAPTLHANMRLAIPGAIRRQPFDAVILGTSILENTSADEASQLLGHRYANLSISAGDFFERGLVLDYLLVKHPVTHVVYSLDFIYLNQRKGYRLFPLSTFDFLYDGNRLNDIRAYLNEHTLSCLMHWSQDAACIGRPLSLNRPNAWMHDPGEAVRFGGLDHWCRSAGHPQIRDLREKLNAVADRLAAGVPAPTAEESAAHAARAIAYVDDNLLRIVASHPHTRFTLVFPPYSRAKFALWYQTAPQDAASHRAVIRHLVDQTRQLGNLEILGFEDQDFPDDLANYKDLDHFRPEINTGITTAIANHQQRLTPANVESYLDIAERRARAFDLVALARRLNQCEQP